MEAESRDVYLELLSIYLKGPSLTALDQLCWTALSPAVPLCPAGGCSCRRWNPCQGSDAATRSLHT